MPVAVHMKSLQRSMESGFLSENWNVCVCVGGKEGRG